MGGCPADTVRPKLFFHEPFPEQETVEPVFDTFYWEFKIFKCHISGTQIRWLSLTNFLRTCLELNIFFDEKEVCQQFQCMLFQCWDIYWEEILYNFSASCTRILPGSRRCRIGKQHGWASEPSTAPWTNNLFSIIFKGAKNWFLNRKCSQSTDPHQSTRLFTGPLCPRDKSCFLLAFLLSHTQREVVASSGNIT